MQHFLTSVVPQHLKPFDVTHEGKQRSMANNGTGTAAESFQLGVLRRVDAQGEPLAGYMRVHVVDLAEIRENISGLRAAARESEAVLSKLSVLFEETKNLSEDLYEVTKQQFLVNDHSGNGCWLPRRDFWNAKAILIDFVHVAIEGWEKELTWLASKLFEYEQTANFIFVQCKTAGDVEAFREVGFRRVANSTLFCLAKDPTHKSHTIAADKDAPFKTQPVPVPILKSKSSQC